MSAKSQLDNESGKKTNDFISGVRKLAVMFSSAFRKSANDESLHELDKQAVQKVELNFSSKFIKRIAKLKSSEGRGRGQLTGMYMQYVLERVVREYYQVTLPSSEVSQISDQRVNKIRKKLDDNELDVKRHIRDYYDLSLSELDPVAPLLIYISRSSGDSVGNHLQTLYKLLKKKEYDLLTEYREKIFGCLTRELKVDKIISEYSVSGLNCRGRIDIFCGELLIDSKCTVRNDFHVDLSQLLLYKLLVQECSPNIVKQVMIVNPCLNYVYIVNVEHWKGTHFREVLNSHRLNRSVSTPNLISDSQRQCKNTDERDKRQDNKNSLTKENIALIDRVHDLEEQNAILVNRVKHLEERNAILTIQNEDLKKKNDSLTSRVDELESGLSLLKKQVADLKKQIVKQRDQTEQHQTNDPDEIEERLYRELREKFKVEINVFRTEIRELNFQVVSEYKILQNLNKQLYRFQNIEASLSKISENMVKFDDFNDWRISVSESLHRIETLIIDQFSKLAPKE